MCRYSKQIISVLCSFAILFTSFVVPASATSADAGEYIKKGFEEYLELTQKITDPLLPIRPFLDFWAELKKTSATPATAYTDYVNTLPGSQYGKDGKFGLQYHSDICAVCGTSTPVLDDGRYYKITCSSSYPFARFIATSDWRSNRLPFIYWNIPIKASGTYSFLIPSVSADSKCTCYFQFSKDGGKTWTVILQSAATAVIKDFYCDASFQFCFYSRTSVYDIMPDRYTVIDPCPGKVPTVRFKEAGLGTPPNVKPNTRTGSLAGDFGYYDKGGKLIPVKNIHIVNETDNSIYNPVTNTTTNFTDWNYDYSTRTYTLTIDNSTTQTITYGDEYVTINQGDTVTNIYYVTPPPPTPSTCVHSYAPTVTTPPTCTLPGVRTQTCPKCKDSYTEPIPATGHSWAVKTTVQTVYDATGALVTQGYTVYKCSVCGEEYKDTGGTGPPGGIGGGGSADSGTGNIWDKLGTLLGTAATGFITVLKTAVVKILDAVVSLFEAINAKLASVTTAIFGLFDRIPQLFGGFSGFLAAVFPFLPVEVFDIVTLTILLLAAATLIKFFMKR